MSVKQFWRDDDGVILPYVAITLVVIIGLSALALDVRKLIRRLRAAVHAAWRRKSPRHYCCDRQLRQ